MATQTQTTDKGVGLAMVLGALTVLGAVGMILGAMELAGFTETLGAYAFGAAMVFASIAVVGLHVWE
ncbi:hypothetical protein ACFQGT_00530 [Natrialbaceae archaeon GCM10025810]|uniref:DUF7525 family protein n=1 Tax=Halovalidus salilacus TaxID=3075124 RepID=UPI00361E4695